MIVLSVDIPQQFNAKFVAHKLRRECFIEHCSAWHFSSKIHEISARRVRPEIEDGRLACGALELWSFGRKVVNLPPHPSLQLALPLHPWPRPDRGPVARIALEREAHPKVRDLAKCPALQFVCNPPAQ